MKAELTRLPSTHQLAKPLRSSSHLSHLYGIPSMEQASPLPQPSFSTPAAGCPLSPTAMLFKALSQALPLTVTSWAF